MGKPLLWQPHNPKTKLRRNSLKVCDGAIFSGIHSAKREPVKKARLEIGGETIDGYLLENVSWFPLFRTQQKEPQVFFQPLTESMGHAFYTRSNRKGEIVLVRKPVKSKFMAELVKFCKENAK